MKIKIDYGNCYNDITAKRLDIEVNGINYMLTEENNSPILRRDAKEVFIGTLKKGSIFYFNNRKHTVLMKRNQLENQDFKIVAEGENDINGPRIFWFDELIVEVLNK